MESNTDLAGATAMLADATRIESDDYGYTLCVYGKVHVHTWSYDKESNWEVGPCTCACPLKYIVEDRVAKAVADFLKDGKTRQLVREGSLEKMLVGKEEIDLYRAEALKKREDNGWE